jgi:uncharacterized protein (TIGR02145 family)
VPTDAEWTQLINYLGGESIAGSKLKQSDTTISNDFINETRNGFRDSLVNSTNETGFAALPGGYREGIGTFSTIGNNGYWWSASGDSNNKAWERIMKSDSNAVTRICFDKEAGFSIRCIMDEKN